LKKIIVFFSLLFFYTSAFAISQKQLELLQIVRDVAKLTPCKNGKTYPDTLAAICLRESSAGKNLIGDFHKNTPITEASLGVMQIKVSTVRYVALYTKKLKWTQKKSDKQIANLLFSNNRFSATVAANYFRILIDYRKTYFYAVSGYNGGYYNYTYYKKIIKDLRYIQYFVKKGVLT